MLCFSSNVKHFFTSYNNIGNLSGKAIGNIANGGIVPNPALEPSSAKEFEMDGATIEQTNVDR